MWQEMERFRRRRIRSTIRKVLVLTAPKPRVRTVWKHPRTCAYWDEIVPTYTDKQWISKFRMSKGTFDFICGKVEPILRPDPHSLSPQCSLSVEKIVAIAVYKLAHVAEYSCVGELFGVHKSTVHNCLYSFCLALTHLIANDYVVMPDAVEAAKIADDFQDKCNIPQIIGAIDSTHIPITAPEDGHQDFVNQKFYCSFVLQAIVDNQYLFRDISCKMPGSCHDAEVLRESNFYRNVHEKMPAGVKTVDGKDVPFMILGDPAYPLKPWLLKNFSYDRYISPEMDSFNVYCNKGRVVVENAFGRLKARWRVLCKRSEIDYAFMPTVIAACCILHNICEMSKEIFNNAWLAEAEAEFENQVADDVANFDAENHPDAEDLRDHLMLYFAANFPILSSFRGRLAVL